MNRLKFAALVFSSVLFLPGISAAQEEAPQPNPPASAPQKPSPDDTELEEKTELLNNALEEIVNLKNENQNLSAQNALLLNKNLELHKASGYLREGRLFEASEELKKIVEMDPEDADAISSLGVLYCELKQFDQAIAQLERLTMLRPQDATAYANLGFAWLQSGSPTKASENFQKAITLKPDFAVAHYNLGLASIELGERERAVQHFRTAATLFDPASPWQHAANEKVRRYSAAKGE